VIRLAFLLLAGLLLPGLSHAAPDLSGFAYRQHPGSQVPLQALLRTDTGTSVRLGDLLGKRPAILVLGYFHCPNLCGVLRDDVFNALSGSGLQAPGDYTLLAVSIDPSETTADAAQAKRADLARNPLPGGEQSWHYLTGTADQVQAIEDAVGFPARFDPQLKQFLHPAGLVVLTRHGRVSGYLLGIGFKPGDLRAAVVRARDGGVAKAALPVLLLCFHFDPSTGRYTLAIFKVLQLGGALTLLTVGGCIALALWRERRP
jgi:protein SCO1/2